MGTVNDEALIEELARVIGQQIEGPAEDMDGPWYGKPLWASYTNEARAILPIISRREIEAGEKVREAAVNMIDDLEVGWRDTYDTAVSDAYTALRALDVATILKGQGDD